MNRDQDRTYLHVAFSVIVVVAASACGGQFDRELKGHPIMVRAAAMDQAGDMYHARMELLRARDNPGLRKLADEYLNKMKERAEKAKICPADIRVRIKMTRFKRTIGRLYFRMGVCYYTMRRDKEALKYFNLAANIKKSQPIVFVRRALVRERMGDIVGAGEDLRRALNVQKDYSPALFHLGLYLVRRGRYFDASKIASKISPSRGLYSRIIIEKIKKEKEVGGR